MRPIYQAGLVNGVFGDPGVYIDLKFCNRALLFDIGDISGLPTRKLLRITDVFVSHTHMDHFAGFDHLLRVCLGRDAGVRIYGPSNFIDQVEHKLHAYTWNLVENYVSDFAVTVHELDGRQLRQALFRSRNRFRREPLPDSAIVDDIVLQDEQFLVRARPFDHHGLPSYAFAFEEHTHLNVWKNRLEELGLPTGPWLTELKHRVRAGEPDDSQIEVRWRTREGSRSERFSLGELKHRVLESVPGQRVCYVTDVAGHENNTRELISFLRAADVAFIEAVFLEEDRAHAERKAHLTAAQSGAIARAAGVHAAVPFHFSTRYFPEERSLRDEFERSYAVSADISTEIN
ncbi:MAG TPA: MBL fold metallo-hydrolase [Steroidobacteraceae bacterium]|nr:MBL fold metallo-hydrolase [Steroidobacteraceae bacterium]